jgi:NADP-dependent 3-hydroxy acid dehydrogenase YdfG
MRGPFSAVIITGASSGLGAALAKAYSGPHVALGLLARDRQRLEATGRACEERGAIVSTALIDVTDRTVMASWLREFDRQHPVELLVANAGTSGGPDPESPSEGAEAVSRLIGVNLLGAINTIEPLLPALSLRRHRCSRVNRRVSWASL